jgi:excinuclease ABC subunit C
MLGAEHDFPMLAKHRGARDGDAEYFGPFAHAGAVNRTIIALQKAFLLRSCSDSMFASRRRPCLQYHIKRCSAPCVGYVTKEEYARQIQDARDFLTGKSSAVQARLAAQMQALSEAREYEEAAKFRDRIQFLTSIQTRQDINLSELGDADVIAICREEARSCVQVFFFRAGQNYGNRAYFPRHGSGEETGEILTAFLAQFYENKPVPPEIVVSEPVPEKDLLEEAFSLRRSGKARVKITCPARGVRRRIADFVIRNAQEALAREQTKLAGEKSMLEEVARLFDLDKMPERIEVYDNSHISGTDMVGAMIVAGPEGFRKNAYRKFNIRAADAADDYGMMREVMTRRFRRAMAEERGPGTPEWPDLLLIDGGLGQLNAVMEALEEVGVAGDLCVVSIAKGEDRNAGRERFFMPGRAEFRLPEHAPVLHYLQRLRDEAHRFAIGAHRTRRAMHISESPLDGVPGIGAKRKKALLLHFGSAKAVAGAAIKDLEAVDGISNAVARRIYGYFHEGES